MGNSKSGSKQSKSSKKPGNKVKPKPMNDQLPVSPPTMKGKKFEDDEDPPQTFHGVADEKAYNNRIVPYPGYQTPAVQVMPPIQRGFAYVYKKSHPMFNLCSIASLTYSRPGRWTYLCLMIYAHCFFAAVFVRPNVPAITSIFQVAERMTFSYFE
jgi:hypothetical protein